MIAQSNDIIPLSFGGNVTMEDDIVIITIKPNTIISAAKADEMKKACLKFKPEGNFLCLVYVGPGAGTDDTIMPYIKDPNNTVSKAQAIILSSSLQIIFLNLYNRLLRNINEVKAFSNKEEAIKWLRSR